MSAAYYDYRFRFPVAGLALALGAIDALRAAGMLRADELPCNMLGDPIDANGEPTSESAAAIIARRGVVAGAFTDPNTGIEYSWPARGNAGYWYFHIRATVAPDAVPFDPATYGFEPVDAVESAAVLGVWA